MTCVSVLFDYTHILYLLPFKSSVLAGDVFVSSKEKLDSVANCC